MYTESVHFPYYVFFLYVFGWIQCEGLFPTPSCQHSLREYVICPFSLSHANIVTLCWFMQGYIAYYAQTQACMTMYIIESLHDCC